MAVVVPSYNKIHGYDVSSQIKPSDDGLNAGSHKVIIIMLKGTAFIIELDVSLVYLKGCYSANK